MVSVLCLASCGRCVRETAEMGAEVNMNGNSGMTECFFDGYGMP